MNGYIGTCTETGKRQWPSRRAAQATSKQIRGNHMSAYRCDHCEFWHLGHLPRNVVHGFADRRAYADRVRARRDAS